MEGGAAAELRTQPGRSGNDLGAQLSTELVGSGKDLGAELSVDALGGEPLGLAKRGECGESRGRAQLCQNGPDWSRHFRAVRCALSKPRSSAT